MLTRKTEIILNKKQKEEVKNYANVCNYLKNKYVYDIFLNQKLNWKIYWNFEFEKYVNNVLYLKKKWIKKAPTKIRKNLILKTYISYKNFLKRVWKRPKFKNKNFKNFSLYFETSWKNKPFNQKWNLFYLTNIGYVKIKNHKYIEKWKYNYVVLTYKNWKYYWNFVDKNKNIEKSQWTKTIWIDFGIRNLIVCSDWFISERINTKNIEEKMKKIKTIMFNNKKKWSLKYKKLMNKYLKLKNKKFNIEEDYLNKLCIKLFERWVWTIKLETLEVNNFSTDGKDLLKNSFIKNNLLWWRLKKKLEDKFNVVYIDKFFPSTKMCSNCWFVKEKIKLSEKLFKCENCKFEINRDLNASINILNCKEIKKV